MRIVGPALCFRRSISSSSLDATEKDERFKGQLKTVETMLREEQGLIIRPPGTGKTQIALGFAAQCQTRVLVLVHTEDILNQWVEYIENAIPSLKGNVGVIRGKTCTDRSNYSCDRPDTFQVIPEQAEGMVGAVRRCNC
jgi:superfamily II DNA or RNA helicase